MQHTDLALASKGIFERQIEPKEATIVLLPVCWDATTSYHAGTAGGPAAIAAASHQLDFFDWQWGHYIDRGIYLDAELISQTWELNEPGRKASEDVRAGGRKAESARAEVNMLSQEINDLVEKRTEYWLQRGKLVALVGGDHASPFGYVKALSKQNSEFGILHIDAHYDYRDSYEGFTHSHASIMRNLSQLPSVKGFAHVGIRDFCQEEYDFATQTKAKSWLGPHIANRLFAGESWKTLCSEIVAALPQNVYVSLDVDGLDPAFCPSTGTPVPGGLSYDQMIYLIEAIDSSGKTVVGFDLSEVSPSRDGSQWDENVGARLLYKLCGLYLRSQNKF